MAMIVRLLICAALVATCPTAVGQLVPDVPVTKSQWIAYLESTAPLFLCRRTSELRTCFPLSSQMCEEDIASATRVCTAQVESDLPETIPVLQGELLGAKVSECVTTAFSALHRSIRSDRAECKRFIKPGTTSGPEHKQAEKAINSQAEVDPAIPASVERSSKRAAYSSKVPAEGAIEAVASGEADATSRRATPAAATGDVLYTLVSPKDLGNFWTMAGQAKEEPDYPMALKGSNTFCIAVGFGIDAGGVPNSVSPLHTTSMPGATERKLRIAVERYINGLRFTPTTQGPSGVQVFTYIVLGRYSYRHGSTDGEKDRRGSQIVTECARVAEHKLAALRARSR